MSSPVLRKDLRRFTPDAQGYRPSPFIKERRTVTIQPELCLMLMDAWYLRMSQMRASGEVPAAERVPSFSRMVEAALYAQLDALKDDNFRYIEEQA